MKYGDLDIKRVVMEPPEDWGHEDCTVCEEAQQISILEVSDAQHLRDQVVELSNGQMVRIMSVDG